MYLGLFSTKAHMIFTKDKPPLNPKVALAVIIMSVNSITFGFLRTMYTGGQRSSLYKALYTQNDWPWDEVTVGLVLLWGLLEIGNSMVNQ